MFIVVLLIVKYSGWQHAEYMNIADFIIASEMKYKNGTKRNVKNKKSNEFRSDNVNN